MNGKKRIPYAHVLYAAALTALLSACAQSDCVPEAGTVSSATRAAVAPATDMPEIVITASRELPEVIVTASRETPDVAG
jgi:type IV pilus biogenesis protein CpaD/CtpE